MVLQQNCWRRNENILGHRKGSKQVSRVVAKEGKRERKDGGKRRKNLVR